MDEIQLTVENFENSSKNLSKLIDCQIVDKCKTSLGYNVVPPPYTGNFMPPKPDFSFSGLEEFTSEPIVTKHIVENSEAKASEAKPKAIRKNNGALIIKDWVSKSEEEDVPRIKIEKKIVKHSFTKIEFVKPKGKTARKTAKQVDCKKVNQKQFQNTKPIWNNAKRVNHQNFAKKTHPYPKKNMVPRVVLMKSGLVSLNTARQVNTAHSKITVNSARPMTNLSKLAHSTVKPKEVVNAARPKAVVNAVKGNSVNDVKASAYWVWKPKTKVLDHGNPQMDLQDQGVIDSRCSSAVLKAYDREHVLILLTLRIVKDIVALWRLTPKKWKITGKCTNQNCSMNKEHESSFCDVENGIIDENFSASLELLNKMELLRGNQSNSNACTKACDDVGKARMETIPSKDYILLPLWTVDLPFSQCSKSSPNDGSKPSSDDKKKVDEDPRKDSENINQEKDDNDNNTNNVNTASTNEVNAVGGKTSIELLDDLNMPALEDIVYSDDDEDVGAEADMNNLDTTIQVSPIPTTRIHKDHPVEHIIGDLTSAPQTRIITKNLEEHVELPNGKQAIGKIDEEVYVCQPLGFKDPDFPDRRGKIDKTLFIRRDKGDILLVQVYVDDIIFRSIKKSLCIEFEKMIHKKFQMSSTGELIFFLGLQVKQEDVIFISQDKYVTEILKKFGFSDVNTASTPMETQNLLLKDEDGEEVDVHLYRAMIGSLMYLTSSRPNIMFAMCACARYQVNPKFSHLYVVKRIFRYLKGQPKLGLWYPKD
ncbi:uncharacterized mitochondrial protein-like protein [Tanacetum coccineum]